MGTDRKGHQKGVNKSTELIEKRESTHFWVFQSTASDGKWKICEMNKTWNLRPISRSVLLIQYCPHLYWSSISHLSKGCHTLRAAQIIHECSLNVNFYHDYAVHQLILILLPSEPSPLKVIMSNGWQYDDEKSKLCSLMNVVCKMSQIWHLWHPAHDAPVR